MDAAEKARKKAEKEAAKTASLTKEDKFDAFGNKIEEKEAQEDPQVGAQEDQEARRRRAQGGKEIWTDEEVEKEGWEIPV